MDFANYFIIRALEHGWEILKGQTDDIWMQIMPQGIPEAEKLRAKAALISQGIEFRMVYAWALDNKNTNVVACGLQETMADTHESNMLADPFEERTSWFMHQGRIAIYIATYNEFLLMLISNIVHTIMNSYVTDGWFTRQGFDHMKQISAMDLHPEGDVERPRTAQKYLRCHTWFAKMTTELPHLKGPLVVPIKPIFIGDESVATDSVLDPTTGDEYDLGGTLRGGVTRT